MVHPHKTLRLAEESVVGALLFFKEMND